MRTAELGFIDSGASIALASTRDPLHDRARTAWERLLGAGARLHVLMTQRRIRVAFALDSHFATAGFRMLG